MPLPGVTVQLLESRDLTSEGCLGGPVGCRDSVTLEIARGSGIEKATLYVAHTEAQKQQGVNRVAVLDRVLTLKSLNKDKATFRFETPKSAK